MARHGTEFYGGTISDVNYSGLPGFQNLLFCAILCTVLSKTERCVHFPNDVLSMLASTLLATTCLAMFGKLTSHKKKL